MAFPVTTRYFVKFHHSNTGLSPTFVFYKRADTLADLSQPSISAVGSGIYYFPVTFSATTDPDVVFQVDGGSGITDEAVRYVSDVISPRNYCLDEAVTTAVSDVKGTSSVSLTDVSLTLGTPRTSLEPGVPPNLSDDIQIVNLNVGNLPTDVDAQLTRLLGLCKENTVLDETTFDSLNNMTAYRLQIYASASDIENNGSPLERYNATITYASGTSNIQRIVWERYQHQS